MVYDYHVIVTEVLLLFVREAQNKEKRVKVRDVLSKIKICSKTNINNPS